VIPLSDVEALWMVAERGNVNNCMSVLQHDFDLLCATGGKLNLCDVVQGTCIAWLAAQS